MDDYGKLPNIMTNAELSAEEVLMIRKFWNLIEFEAPKYFLEIFSSFLAQYPDSLAKFPHFSRLDRTQLQKSPLILAHAHRISATLSSIIQVLDQSDVLEGTLFLLAHTHICKKASIDEFKVFTSLVSNYFSKWAECNNCDVEATTACVNKLMSVIIETMAETMNMVLPQQNACPYQPNSHREAIINSHADDSCLDTLKHLLCFCRKNKFQE